MNIILEDPKLDPLLPFLDTSYEQNEYLDITNLNEIDINTILRLPDFANYLQVDKTNIESVLSKTQNIDYDSLIKNINDKITSNTKLKETYDTKSVDFDYSDVWDWEQAIFRILIFKNRLNIVNKYKKVPKPEAPKTEAPKTEAPKTEAPKTEAPKPEAPKPEAPTLDPAQLRKEKIKKDIFAILFLLLIIFIATLFLYILNVIFNIIVFFMMTKYRNIKPPSFWYVFAGPIGTYYFIYYYF